MDVARNAVRGACALCSREGRNLIHSHIIPRFLFKPMARLAPGTPECFGLGLPRLRPGQPKEPLLCVSCEKKFSLGERYASRRLRDFNSIALNTRAAGIRADGLNYEVLRIFFLSVMWRASVASHPLFDRVRLGRYEVEMLDILRASDPGPPYRFPVLMYLIEEDDFVRHALVTPPLRFRIDNAIAHEMVAHGVGITWITGGRGWTPGIQERALHDTGVWKITRKRASESAPYRVFTRLDREPQHPRRAG